MKSPRDKYPPPPHIDGTPVEVSGSPLIRLDEKWVTLIPIDHEDPRHWEFNVTTGRGPLLTRGPEDRSR